MQDNVSVVGLNSHSAVRPAGFFLAITSARSGIPAIGTPSTEVQ
jgi:hypothetical protein